MDKGFLKNIELLSKTCLVRNSFKHNFLKAFLVMQSQREKETRKLLAFANILHVAGRKAYATQNNFSALPRKMDEVQTFFLTLKIYFLCSDPILRGF
ncbi:MAG: hypothetical protein PUG20_03440 [Chlamydia suis]|nr:hypothetical protein [Chlamydia suis]MDY4960562.1 hypothetical protein [Chlamydia suis]